jgi:hypothetical protein
MNDRTEALRIACADFSPDEKGALRSLLKLLEQYLRRRWLIVEEGEADLLLKNLDVTESQCDMFSRRVIGCALKPRTHLSGTIHRPLRASEILSLLNEHDETAASVSELRIEWSYRLRAWPLDLTNWPRHWWPAFALMTPTARSQGEISSRTGLDQNEIHQCLARLQTEALLERFAARRHVASNVRDNVGVWRSLARRVGRVLGFAA